MSKIKFTDLNLSKDVLKAISDMGFEETTPIQSQAIPEVLSGKDVIGQASTGTGKTAAFGLPAIEKIDESLRAVQVIVLCPTRELAIQVSSEMNKFLRYKKKITSLPVYGGQPIQRQLFGLRKFPQIVVGTPGRTLDHIKRGTLRLDKIKMVILDEADEMLDMGFRQDIQEILRGTPKVRQTVLFSATMSREILELTRRFQKDPKLIRIAGESISAKMVEQSYFDVEASRKTRLLAQLLTEHNPRLALIFCNTKRNVDRVCDDLRAHGFYSAAIHGDIRQAKRDSIMNKFRREQVNILVATDVAARGIDVSNIEVVFNYGIPRERESYVHRIGRTGRAGKAGKAISLVSRAEFRQLRDIMRYTRADIKREQVKNLPDIEFTSRDKTRRDMSESSRNTSFTEKRGRSFDQNSRSLDQNNRPDSVFEKINSRIKRIRKDESSKYSPMFNDLVNANNSLENVTAALLQMVVEGENKPKRFSRRRFN